MVFAAYSVSTGSGAAFGHDFEGTGCVRFHAWSCAEASAKQLNNSRVDAYYITRRISSVVDAATKSSLETRQNMMEAQIGHHGMSIERFYAVRTDDPCISQFSDPSTGALLHDWRGWTLPTLSLTVTNLDIMRMSIHCGSHSQHDWLLVMEDDAAFPSFREHGSFEKIIEAIVGNLPGANLIWLDLRSGKNHYFDRNPGVCCLSGVLYRKSFLPQLLSHLDVDRPGKFIHMKSVDDAAHGRPSAIDTILPALMNRYFTNQSAVVPLVGTAGLPSTLQHDSHLKKMTEHSYSLLPSSTWCDNGFPEWLVVALGSTFQNRSQCQHVRFDENGQKMQGAQRAPKKPVGQGVHQHHRTKNGHKGGGGAAAARSNGFREAPLFLGKK